MSKSARSLSQALTAASACKSFLHSKSIDDELDELLVFRLRGEVENLVNGIGISLKILERDDPEGDG